MCYYNGIKVTREEKVRLVSLAKLVREYEFMHNPLYIGPRYPKMPMMRRVQAQEDFEIVLKEWGFLPPFIESEERVTNFRENFMTLNAKVENLFTNEEGKESMYAEAAMERRCLIPSTHFFEWRHLKVRGDGGRVLKKTVAQPYRVELHQRPLFYFAGLWNPNNLHGDTFTIVTTEANLLMSRVHNIKKRMPTILTEDLAWDWLFNDKLSKADIQHIGSFQYDSVQMQARTVDRHFITSAEPEKLVNYNDVPALGDDDFLITPQLGLFN